LSLSLINQARCHEDVWGTGGTAPFSWVTCIMLYFVTKIQLVTHSSHYPFEVRSESELLYDWRFTANQFVLTTSPLRLTTSNFIFQLNTCRYSPYVTSSLTRGWFYRLQLLLVLASAVILTFDSHGTHDHILLSEIRESPNLEGQVPVFISPRNRVARLYPQALGSLFVASYDSKGYGGGIRPRLHSAVNPCTLNRYLQFVPHGKHITSPLKSLTG
jgi:hypothetical protein